MVYAVARPAMIGSLLVYVLLISRERWCRQKVLLMIGMLSCGMADVLLLSEESEYFTLGVLVFALAYVCYTVVMTFPSHRPLEISFIRRFPWVMMLLGVFGYWLFTEMQKGAGAQLLPVTIYLLPALIMLLLALDRLGKVGATTYRWVTAGAVLVTASAVLLVYSMFGTYMPGAPIYIFTTYGLGQLLLVSGVVEQLGEKV